MDTKKLVVMASACVAIAVAVIFTPPSSPCKFLILSQVVFEVFFRSRLYSYLDDIAVGGGLGVTSADLVVKNALIYTSDPSHPWAESMAIRNNRILHIGGLSSLQALVGQKTQFLDLHGKVVVPGFIDSHVHFISGGLQMAQVDLHDVKSQVEFVRKVEQAVHGTKRGCWILGGGWNSENWGGELPQASWIDDVTPHHPVWLPRVDGHMGLANSVALAKAGIQNMTHDIGGGSIIRNADGGPSGLLVDAAMQLLLHHIPEVTIEERRDAMIRASNLALSRGVTTVVDFGRYYPGTSTTDVWQDFFDVYKWADATGNMLLRVCLFFPLETWSRVVDTLKASGRSLSQWLHIGGVKGFADGSLGSNSALFYEPYADDTNNYGIQVANPYFLLDSAIESDKSGVQVAIHAIGDKANDMVLSISKALILKHGVKDRRFRIEHAQHLSLGATDRFGANQVIASVQPQHLLDDAVSAIKKLGERRALQGSYLFHSLLLSNTRLAFGSDWPVANLDPLEGIKAATHRMPQNCSTSWIPSECVTVDAALDGFTSSAAFSIFMDNEIGSLSIGKWADFVVLSKNIFNVTNQESFPYVLATYVGGVQAYP